MNKIPFKNNYGGDSVCYKREGNNFFHDLHYAKYKKQLLDIYTVDRWQKAMRSQRCERNDIYKNRGSAYQQATTIICYVEDIPYIKIIGEKIPNMEKVCEYQCRFFT